MKRLRLAAMAGALFVGRVAAAQQPAAVPGAVRPELAVGQPAPDFSLAAATRYGTLKERIRLSDLHGKTVILAFFYQARTKG